MPSPPRTRQEFLDAPVSTLAPFILGVRCSGVCRRTTARELKPMAQDPRYRDRRLGDLLPRLRCRNCMERPSQIWLTDSPASEDFGGPLRTWRVDVWP